MWKTKTTNSRGEAYWVCKCSCGNYKEINGTEIRRGNIKSCGCTISHGENKINNILKEHNILYTTQKTFDTCLCQPNNIQSKARFDFYIDDKHLIEFDGVQHFEYSGRSWGTKERFEKTQRYDAIKNQWCKDNNIPLIRIPYTHYDDLCIEDLMLETTKFKVV